MREVGRIQVKSRAMCSGVSGRGRFGWRGVLGLEGGSSFRGGCGLRRARGVGWSKV